MRGKFALVSVVVVVLTGCKVEPDPNAQEKIQQGAQNAWNSTRDAASKAGDAIKKSSAQAKETARIRIGMSGRDDIDTSNLSVETIDKTVYLKGTVPTATQAAKVFQIANVNKDADYNIENDLKVAGPPTKDKTKPSASQEWQKTGSGG